MRLAVLGYALVMFVASAAAQSDTWSMDQQGSALRFAVRVEKATARGDFRKFDVSGRLDPDRLEGSRIDVEIDVASADIGSDDINVAIRGADWFNAQRYPVANFHATQVRREGPDRLVASGTLTVKGIDRTVDVPFSWKGLGEGRAVISGEMMLDRRTFGIGVGEWAATDVIAADVVIAFTVRLVRKS